jgi:hypothetical protein
MKYACSALHLQFLMAACCDFCRWSRPTRRGFNRFPIASDCAAGRALRVFAAVTSASCRTAAAVLAARGCLPGFSSLEAAIALTVFTPTTVYTAHTRSGRHPTPLKSKVAKKDASKPSLSLSIVKQRAVDIEFTRTSRGRPVDPHVSRPAPLVRTLVQKPQAAATSRRLDGLDRENPIANFGDMGAAGPHDIRAQRLEIECRVHDAFPDEELPFGLDGRFNARGLGHAEPTVRVHTRNMHCRILGTVVHDDKHQSRQIPNVELRKALAVANVQMGEVSWKRIDDAGIAVRNLQHADVRKLLSVVAEQGAVEIIDLQCNRRQLYPTQRFAEGPCLTIAVNWVLEKDGLL